MMVILAGNI